MRISSLFLGGLLVFSAACSTTKNRRTPAQEALFGPSEDQYVESFLAGALDAFLASAPPEARRKFTAPAQPTCPSKLSRDEALAKLNRPFYFTDDEVAPAAIGGPNSNGFVGSPEDLNELQCLLSVLRGPDPETPFPAATVEKILKLPAINTRVILSLRHELKSSELLALAFEHPSINAYAASDLIRTLATAAIDPKERLGILETFIQSAVFKTQPRVLGVRIAREFWFSGAVSAEDLHAAILLVARVPDTGIRAEYFLGQLKLPYAGDYTELYRALVMKESPERQGRIFSQFVQSGLPVKILGEEWKRLGAIPEARVEWLFLLACDLFATQSKLLPTADLRWLINLELKTPKMSERNISETIALIGNRAIDGEDRMDLLVALLKQPYFTETQTLRLLDAAQVLTTDIPRRRKQIVATVSNHFEKKLATPALRDAMGDLVMQLPPDDAVARVRFLLTQYSMPESFVSRAVDMAIGKSFDAPLLLMLLKQPTLSATKLKSIAIQIKNLAAVGKVAELAALKSKIKSHALADSEIRELAESFATQP